MSEYIDANGVKFNSESFSENFSEEENLWIQEILYYGKDYVLNSLQESLILATNNNDEDEINWVKYSINLVTKLINS